MEQGATQQGGNRTVREKDLRPIREKLEELKKRIKAIEDLKAKG